MTLPENSELVFLCSVFIVKIGIFTYSEWFVVTCANDVDIFLVFVGQETIANFVLTVFRSFGQCFICKFCWKSIDYVLDHRVNNQG